ncbi:MAG: CoA transferase [Myxococcales bacterium]|nr:CoA transferase [Myxococcales bacterium]
MGPLKGFTILEFAGIGPGPFAAMVLADLGAEVIRIDRTEAVRNVVGGSVSKDIMNRGRRSLAVDLKSPEGLETVLKLVEQADGLIEGFRPGVMERLGLGPQVCLGRNTKLVFGRMTGWGQDGPLAKAAGHDINYIALAGALDPIGRKGQAPVPPLNLVGDFGGGGMLLVVGMLAALLEAGKSGEGQVVDAAMVDGAALLMTFFFGLREMGAWHEERGTNILDTGAHFYDAYETSDGLYVSLGSIEPQFYSELIKLAGLEGEDLPGQMSRDDWPMMKERIEKIMKTKTRAEWCEIMEGTDVCFAPVLTMTEAPEHPHNKSRGTFVEHGGVLQPGPAPRFSRTPGAIERAASMPGQHTDDVLARFGFAADEIARLREAKAIA